jgi:hypothetical protein
MDNCDFVRYIPITYKWKSRYNWLRMLWCRAHSRTCDQILIPVRGLLSLSLWGAHYDERLGLSFVNLCSNLSVCTLNIYISCNWHRSPMHTQYIQSLFQSRLGTACSTSYWQLTLPRQSTLEQSYKWPPPSLSLLYFLCGVSPWPIHIHNSINPLWVLTHRM